MQPGHATHRAAPKFIAARALALLLALALAGCGGGSGGSSTTASTPAAPSPAASGTGSGSTVGSTAPAAGASTPIVPQSTTANVQPITVTTASGSTPNMLMTSVTICAPGTSNCATIGNVQVDTGSQGLRILASALPSSLALPTVAAGSSGAPAGECAVFAGGYAWGAVRAADVKLAGELAAATPVQVIADATLPTVPSDCAASGRAMQTASGLRANGILGIGLFSADCGGGCIVSALPRWYYSCPSGGACTATAQPLAQQVTNPVSAFASDNNGVVIDLPAIGDNGAATVNGSLIFGIGTQADNAMGSATVLTTNSSGYVTTVTNGATYSQSFIDSGSNGLFFGSGVMPACGVWYCPTSPQTFASTLTGVNRASASLSFDVTSSTTLFATSNAAFDNLAGSGGNTFDWGLPFFFGRPVYAAIEASVTPAGNGPFYAF